jgi:hypothetical protein
VKHEYDNYLSSRDKILFGSLAAVSQLALACSNKVQVDKREKNNRNEYRYFFNYNEKRQDEILLLIITSDSI